ncbi:MAG: M81 family metallopeptidase, partial [Erysipelotrichaceae bacterium]|nr:M81 family metallopeptidase [Erysipelotrichaceae bacterium]
MKALVGLFACESNANIPLKNEIAQFKVYFGDDVARNGCVDDVFASEGIEVIPAIYASAGASGVIKKDCFEYIFHCMITAVKEHLHEIDGIYLYLHGASYVEQYGSGDHYIVKEIRKITGPYLPIFVVCDPHGNMTREYAESLTYIRSYRESPHTDAVDTRRQVARELCKFLKDRQNIHACFRKLPLILGGEQSVSTDEPVASINKFMDEMEQDPRVRSASWHVGYIRHDCPEAGCSVVVVPEKEEDQQYCEQKVEELAKYVWDRRQEFHYTGFAVDPDTCMKMALDFEDKPVMITDSGDNVTSGATGWNTYILRQALQAQTDKSFLFANICDPNAYNIVSKLEIGQSADISLGMNADDMSKSVPLNVTVKAKGYLRGYMTHVHDANYGDSCLVHINGTSIDVNIATTRQTMCEQHQFEGASINWDNYDVIVVKQGYAFPEIKEKGKLVIMSLTDGSTLQDTARLPFKLIMRPMFP